MFLLFCFLFSLQTLSCYPAFTKLKTLLLNEWCVAADFRALICILQRSQILENLTIELNKVHIF